MFQGEIFSGSQPCGQQRTAAIRLEVYTLQTLSGRSTYSKAKALETDHFQRFI